MYTTAWWYMLATYAAIWAGVLVEPFWAAVAIFLCLVQVVHFGIQDKNLFSFTCQVRYVLMAILAVGLVEGLEWVWWIPIAGLTLRLTTNYCLLARLVSLLPWNRKRPFSWKLVKEMLFSKPVPGCILQRSKQ